MNYTNDMGRTVLCPVTNTMNYANDVGRTVLCPVTNLHRIASSQAAPSSMCTLYGDVDYNTDV